MHKRNSKYSAKHMMFNEVNEKNEVKELFYTIKNTK